MSKPVNRLATPLPDSVLDRYFAEHPEEQDFRKTAQKAPQGPAKAASAEPVQPTLPTMENFEDFFRASPGA